MIHTLIDGIELHLATSDTVFSPAAVDNGTLAMLSVVSFKSDDKVLDLGCGYGVVGILAAKKIGAEKVILSDLSSEAVTLARQNAQLNGVAQVQVIQSDGFHAIDADGFTLILSNPPYHTDFSVARHFIENSYYRLLPGGRLYMVTKRLAWYKNKIVSVYGGVKIIKLNNYYIFMAEKRTQGKPVKVKKRQMLSRKLRRKYGS
ncbi:MAG: methyltransferase [Ruminococcaceae bacterium]|nr:methyltransferase [Oscillospiraceae bacterium]